MPAEMERWRSFFAQAEVDLWTIIDQAILVAAADFPAEFKHKRCEIAEILFAKRSTPSPRTRSMDATMLSGSVITNATGDVEKKVSHQTWWEADDGLRHSHASRVEVKPGDTPSHGTVSKASAVDTRMLQDDKSVELDTCPQSYNEPKDVTEAARVVAVEHTILQNVSMIKDQIMDSANQSEAELLRSLYALEHLQITVEILKATDIGREVNRFRKHSSGPVRNLVKQLVRTWKGMVDEWVKNAEVVHPLSGGEQAIANREVLVTRHTNLQTEALSQRSLQLSTQCLNKSSTDSTSSERAHVHSEHAVEDMGSSRVESDELYKPGFMERKANSCGQKVHFSRCLVTKFSNGGLVPGKPETGNLEAERNETLACEHHKISEESKGYVQNLTAVDYKRHEAMKRRLPVEDLHLDRAKKQRNMPPSSSPELAKRVFLSARLPASTKSQNGFQRR